MRRLPTTVLMWRLPSLLQLHIRYCIDIYTPCARWERSSAATHARGQSHSRVAPPPFAAAAAACCPVPDETRRQQL